MDRGTLTPRALVTALACALALSLCVPTATSAAPPLGGAPEVLLAFGERYSTEAGESTHSGLDLAGSEGDDVLSPAEGTVAFVGRIPAGTGSTVLACTIDLPDGSKVTLMPLESAGVRAGRSLHAGEALGTLAAGGDRSCAATHLHISQRRGGLYVDPAPLVATVPAQAPQSPATPEPAASPSPAPLAPQAPAAVAVPAPASLAVPSGVQATPVMGSGVSLAPARGAQVRTAAVQQPSSAVAQRGRAAGQPAASAMQLGTLAPAGARDVDAPSSRQAPSASGRAPRSATQAPWSWAAVAGAGFSAVVLLSVRSRRPRLEALLSDVRPVRDHVAAAVDRC